MTSDMILSGSESRNDNGSNFFLLGPAGEAELDCGLPKEIAIDTCGWAGSAVFLRLETGDCDGDGVNDLEYDSVKRFLANSDNPSVVFAAENNEAPISLLEFLASDWTIYL